MSLPIELTHTARGMKVEINDLDQVTLQDLEHLAMKQNVNILERQLKSETLGLLANNLAVQKAGELIAYISYWIDQYAGKSDTEDIPIGKTLAEGEDFVKRLAEQGYSQTLSTVSGRKNPDGSSPPSGTSSVLADASGKVATKETMRKWISHIQSNIQNLMSIQQKETSRTLVMKNHLTQAFTRMNEGRQYFENLRANLK